MSNKVRNLIGFLVFIVTFSGVLAAIGVHYSFFGEHLPERIAITNNDAETAKRRSQPKYNFYDTLRERKSKLSQNKELNKEIKATKATKDVVTADKQYIVQIGAFTTAGDARRTKKRAEKLGYPVKVVHVRRHYLVQAGPFKGKKSTKAAKTKFVRHNFDTLIKLINHDTH